MTIIWWLREKKNKKKKEALRSFVETLNYINRIEIARAL